MDNDNLSFLDNTNKPEIIKGHIRYICQCIQKKLGKYTIESILLTGSASFGGIGVVKLNGFFVPYGDYDFSVMVKDTPSAKMINNLVWEINKELFGGTDPTRGPLIDINVYNSKNKIRLNCDLSSYDSLNTYKVLWGKDFFKNYNLRIDDVPVVSMFRLLMNRFSHLTISFSEQFLSHNPGANEIIDIEKNIIKTYIEIGGAIVFSCHCYTPDINERIPLLQNIAPAFSFSPDDFKILIRKIEHATKMKLKPNKKIYPNWVKERSTAGHYAIKALTGLSGHWLNRDDNLFQNINCFYSEVPKQYFAPYIAYEIKRRTALMLPKYFLTVLSVFANVYERYRFGKKYPSFKFSIYNWQSPILLYYWVILHLFNTSVNNNNCLIESDFLFSLKNKITYPGKIRSWEDIRIIAKIIWDNYAGRNF